MPQSVNWGKRPTKQRGSREKLLDKLDGFVDPNPKDNKTKRLNADIPAELHARVKAGCALEGKGITQVLVELLEKRFPSK